MSGLNQLSAKEPILIGSVGSNPTASAKFFIMEKKLIFVKLAGKWFVLLPDYPGEPMDLEMVSGADVLCESLDVAKNGFISVTVSTGPLNGDEFATNLIVLNCKEVFEEIGATYVKQDSDMEVWLCPVTKYVFGSFPQTIYIRLW